MRFLRYLGAIIGALALLMVPSLAANAVPGGDGLPTDVVITKVEMTSIDDTWPRDHDGTPITDIEGYFGAGTKTLPGVTFKIYKLTDEEYATVSADPTAYDTVAEMENVGELVQTGVTDENGQVTFAGLANGNYWVIEDLTAEGSPMVNKGVAVPFGMVLPMIKSDGSFFGTGEHALHVYPKNTTGDEPEVDKDVTEVGNDSDSANVGDEVEWIIRPYLPADIAEYQRLTFTDVIDPRLDYQNQVVVTLDGVELEAGVDYTLTEPVVGNPGGTLIVDFSPAGIAKLTPGDDLEIRFKTSINETAVVGQPIPNNVKVEYTNGSGVVGDPKEVPPEDQPEVWTGGKRFEKVDSADETALDGAVFELQDEEGNTITWTEKLIAMNKAAIDAGKFATEEGGEYTATSADNVPAVGTPIYLRSVDGQFEIAGLQGYEPADDANCVPTVENKCNIISHSGNYQLVEVQAPDGYAMLTAPITFQVTKTSYWENPLVVDPVAADPLVIDNKKITIPPTGGIGTIVFIVAGLALMGGAALGLRRRTVTA